MAKFNTQNPVGSSDPRDLYDNAENLDKAANSSADTFQDRLGKSRLTWEGIVKAGTGDAGVIVPAVQQAVQDVIAGVDGQVDAAEAQADRAATARDAAFVNAGIADDIASGLSMTSDGTDPEDARPRQFQVVEGSDILVYRHDPGSIAVPLASYPSSAPVASLRETLQSQPGDPFSVAGETGYIALRLSSSGQLETAKLKAMEDIVVNTPVHIDPVDSFAWCVADPLGNVIVGVDAQGRIVGDGSLLTPAEWPDVGPVSGGYRLFDYDINHVFTYGQSLSVGQALPVQSPAPAYDNLMFYRGQRPQYDHPSEAVAEWYSGFVPAIETVSPEEPVLGETPSRGTADMIKQRILDEDGISYTEQDYSIMTSAPGWGATTVAQLSQGSSHFSRMVDQAAAAYNLAQAAGRTYAVQCVTWTQGESDYLSGTSFDDYITRLETLIADTNSAIKGEISQTKDIQFISYQVGSHLYGATDSIPDIALAQLAVSEANELFHIATPVYHLPYQDGFHLTGRGSRWLGAYYGLAYKRVVINGEEWEPLKPVDVIRQGRIIEITFNVPHGPLVFDTVSVEEQSNMGFALVDQTGRAIGLSEVKLVGGDRLRLVADSDVPDGSSVRYAWSGSANVGQGNLRDSQGDAIVFDGDKPMHNWCLIFEMGV